MKLSGIACGRCGHDKVWHRKVQTSPKAYRFECIYEVGFKFCDCKDFVEPGAFRPTAEDGSGNSEGGTMAGKKEKKAKSKKTNGKGKLYRVLVSKLDGGVGKKMLEGKNHPAIVLQSLNQYKNPQTLDTIVTKVKESGKYRSKADVSKLVAIDLNVLSNEGLVEVTEPEVAKAAE